jgi:tetratricopeptide (TPR) repeat protein
MGIIPANARWRAGPHTAAVGLVGFALVFSFLASRTFAQESVPPSLESQISAGVQALKAGDLETAERIFTAAWQHGARHPLVLHNLGVIAQQRGNHRQAVARFREAIRLQPGYGPTHLLLGSSLLAMAKNEDAVRELRRAVALMPDEPAARLQLANAYEASGNWIGAAEELQKLVALAPGDAEYSYQLGKVLTRLSGWSLQEIARLNPDSARLHQALGQEYVIQERYDRALLAYQQAARSDPKLPEIHLGIALVLLELKKFDDALAEINLELRLVPESKIAAQTKEKILAAKAASAP